MKKLLSLVLLTSLTVRTVCASSYGPVSIAAGTIPASPPTGSVQYNVGGLIGGSSNFTFDGSSLDLTGAEFINNTGDVDYLTLGTTSGGDKRTQIKFGPTGSPEWKMGEDSAMNTTGDFFLQSLNSGIYAFKWLNDGSVTFGANGAGVDSAGGIVGVNFYGNGNTLSNIPTSVSNNDGSITASPSTGAVILTVNYAPNAGNANTVSNCPGSNCSGISNAGAQGTVGEIQTTDGMGNLVDSGISATSGSINAITNISGNGTGSLNGFTTLSIAGGPFFVDSGGNLTASNSLYSSGGITSNSNFTIGAGGFNVDSSGNITAAASITTQGTLTAASGGFTVDGMGGITTSPYITTQGQMSALNYTNANSNFSVDSSGNVTGASLITTGGTSSQFVKGDGSLDSTTYQPSPVFSAGYAAATTGTVACKKSATTIGVCGTLVGLVCTTCN